MTSLVTKICSLPEETQRILLSEIIFTRKELINFLGCKSTDIDIKVRNGVIAPVFRGSFLVSTAERIKHQVKKIVTSFPSEYIDLLEEVKRLSEEEQRELVQSVTMSREDAIEYMNESLYNFRILVQQQQITPIKWGVFLKTNLEQVMKQRPRGRFTKNSCINAGIRLANELNLRTLTKKQYNDWGKQQDEHVPSVSTIIAKFTSWNDFLRQAGLEVDFQTSKSRTMPDMEKKQLALRGLREAFNKNNSLTQQEYIAWRKSNTEYPSFSTIVALFDGWNEAKLAAGLPIHRNLKKQKG